MKNLKDKKLILLSILVLIIVVVISYSYLKPAKKEITKKSIKKPTITNPVKPPKVRTYKQEVITVADAGEGEKEAGVDPGGNETLPSGPTNISVDKYENIYVSDSLNSRIKKYNRNGKFIKNISSPIDPRQTVIDNSGNIYVFSDREYEIYKINQNGKILLKYPLSEEISSRGTNSLHEIRLMGNMLYGFTSYSKDYYVPEGYTEGYYTLKIGTIKRTFDSQEQLNSLVKDYLAGDEYIYSFDFVKGISEIVIKNKSGKIIKKFKDKFPRSGGGWNQFLRITKDKIYIAGVPGENIGYTIQAYSKEGYLLSQARPFISSEGTFDWETQFIAAVSNSGNIYMFEGNSDVKKSALKIMKLTLK